MGPYLALPAFAALLSLSLWLSPHVPAGPLLAGLGCFLGATVSSIAALAVLSRADRPRALPWLLGGSIAALGALAVAHASSPWAAVLVDVALVSAAHALGSMLGGRVQHAGHLLPATVVAACADVVSISHPSGPTHLIAESERALSLMAVSFPPPGLREMAPALGVGDLVFTALWLGAGKAHGMPSLRLALLATTGAVASGLASAALDAPFPALPAIGALLLLGSPEARRLERRDRSVAVQAMIIAVVIASFVVVKHRLLGG